MKRRDFLKRSAAGAGALGVMHMCDMLGSGEASAFPTNGGGMGLEEANYYLDRGRERNITPELRPEIANNPRAVFLIETRVDARKDAGGHYTEAVPQLKAEGGRVAEMLFVRGSKKGGTTLVKPNFTYVFDYDYNRTTGVYSSPDFIGGMTLRLRDMGNSNIIAGEGPTNARIHRNGEVYDAFDEAGLNMIEAGYERFDHFNRKFINWRKTPDSLIWRRIPYFRPIADDDNFLITVSSMKCHMTGLTTLTVKNLQGCVPKGYGQFCTAWDDVEPRAERDGIDFRRDFNRNYHELVEASFIKHRAAGFKRWDYFGDYKKYEERGGWEAFKRVKDDNDDRREFLEGIGSLMRWETWIQRGLDNAHVLKPDINIIEGIIALDGEELHRDRIGDDQLLNIVVAGVSPFEVDAVGSYIMGHDPNELWYTRVAKEKGYGECDPEKIDIYWIRDGEVVPVSNLSTIKRHRIGLNWARLENPDERLFW